MQWALFAFAADDLTVDELWARRNSSEAAWDRLLELGPETRELAHRILHPPGQVSAKWPTSGDSHFIEATRADGVSEIILSPRDSVDTDSRVTLMRQLELLGRIARPAADALMTIAIEEDGPEREAALRALAATGAKRDFVIGEAIHMMSVAGSPRMQAPKVGPDRVALVGTWLLQNIQDELIERLYRQSYEDRSGYEWSLTEAIVKCPATDPHAHELVQRKIRPLLDDDACFYRVNPKDFRIAAAIVVLHWNAKDQLAANYLARIVDEESDRNFDIGNGIQFPDRRAAATRALGQLGKNSKDYLPMLHKVMDREIGAGKYSQLAHAAA